MLVSGRFFKPSLMFAGKARSLPQSGSTQMSIIRVGSGLTHKLKTWLERFVKDKHSGLLGTFVSHKKVKCCAVVML